MTLSNRLITGCLALGYITSAFGNSPEKNLEAFPEAKEGMRRVVIFLPHKERGEEDDFKVELIVGKVMKTDGVNSVRLGGKIEDKPLKGWGFTYYEVSKLGPGMSTLIGVAPGTPQVEKFVSGPTTQIRYNSRIPIVIYVPEGVEVRYRLWTAGKTETVAKG